MDPDYVRQLIEIVDKSPREGAVTTSALVPVKDKWWTKFHPKIVEPYMNLSENPTEEELLHNGFQSNILPSADTVSQVAPLAADVLLDLYMGNVPPIQVLKWLMSGLNPNGDAYESIKHILRDPTAQLPGFMKRLNNEYGTYKNAGILNSLGKVLNPQLAPIVSGLYATGAISPYMSGILSAGSGMMGAVNILKSLFSWLKWTNNASATSFSNTVFPNVSSKRPVTGSNDPQIQSVTPHLMHMMQLKGDKFDGYEDGGPVGSVGYEALVKLAKDAQTDMDLKKWLNQRGVHMDSVLISAQNKSRDGDLGTLHHVAPGVSVINPKQSEALSAPARKLNEFITRSMTDVYVPLPGQIGRYVNLHDKRNVDVRNMADVMAKNPEWYKIYPFLYNKLNKNFSSKAYADIGYPGELSNSVLERLKSTPVLNPFGPVFDHESLDDTPAWREDRHSDMSWDHMSMEGHGIRERNHLGIEDEYGPVETVETGFEQPVLLSYKRDSHSRATPLEQSIQHRTNFNVFPAYYPVYLV
jgi:hypothetical protein